MKRLFVLVYALFMLVACAAQQLPPAAPPPRDTVVSLLAEAEEIQQQSGNRAAQNVLNAARISLDRGDPTHLCQVLHGVQSVLFHSMRDPLLGGRSRLGVFASTELILLERELMRRCPQEGNSQYASAQNELNTFLRDQDLSHIIDAARRMLRANTRSDLVCDLAAITRQASLSAADNNLLGLYAEPLQALCTDRPPVRLPRFTH